jgi:hypothetical protein
MLLKLNSRALRIVFLSALILGLVGVAQGTVITLDPQASYLLHDSTDSPAVNPLFVSLSGFGSTIRIEWLGDLCYVGGGGCSEISIANGVGAVFTTSNSISGATNLNRLTGVLPSGVAALVTPNSWANNAVTDIAQDFAVPHASWLNLTVPTGATYLVVGVIDSHFSDNVDPNQNLQFSIEAVDTSAPEPGTLLLFGAGLGVLVAARRLKKVRG